MSAKKILIVEDYADIATIYSFMLKKNGYEVEIAKNGREALEQTLRFQPDVILLDIMIPDIDGLKVLKTIRENKEYEKIQPLILVTTNVMQQDISDQASLYGADGYVLKARLDNQELVKIVEELIAKNEQKSAGDNTTESSSGDTSSV